MIFSQWVSSSGAPLGRLSCPQVSGVWGIRSRDRTARYRISTAGTGNRKRAMAVYQAPASGFAASHAVTASNTACKGAVITSISTASFFEKFELV